VRRYSEKVFEEEIQTGTFYTSSRFDVPLGLYDNLVVQAVVDHVDTTDLPGTLKVHSETSGDGRMWGAKNPGVELFSLTVSPGATTTAAGTDTGLWASLAFVRLKIDLLTTARARVRIYVTARDAGG